jgi:hypothetical protein
VTKEKDLIYLLDSNLRPIPYWYMKENNATHLTWTGAKEGSVPWEKLSNFLPQERESTMGMKKHR